MTELERTKKALEFAMQQLGYSAEGRTASGLAHSTNAARAVDKINAILNPPPEFEEVESVVWQILESNGQKRGCYPDFEPSLSAEEKAKGWQIVKHVGTIKRPKLQKVERSVSVGAMVDHSGISNLVKSGAAEWKDHPEAHGKTGTLTFTWEE